MYHLGSKFNKALEVFNGSIFSIGMKPNRTLERNHRYVTLDNAYQYSTLYITYMCGIEQFLTSLERHHTYATLVKASQHWRETIDVSH